MLLRPTSHLFLGQLTYNPALCSLPELLSTSLFSPLPFLRPSDYEDSYKGRGASSLQVGPLQHHLASNIANDCSETLKGGALGGTVGLALGVGGVFAAAARYPAFRQLTLPLRAFLCTSSATFGGACVSSNLPSLRCVNYRDTAMLSTYGLARRLSALSERSYFNLLPLQ